jgi:hypothetical protein
MSSIGCFRPFQPTLWHVPFTPKSGPWINQVACRPFQLDGKGIFATSAMATAGGF